MSILSHPVVAVEVGAVLLLLLAIVIIGRSLTLSVGSVKAELRPNGGSSLRDAVDRVEAAANGAVTRAESAAYAASVAAGKAAEVLHRIETQYPQSIDVTLHKPEENK